MSDVSLAEPKGGADMTDDLRLVFVEWMDSHTIHEWAPLDAEPMGEPLACQSVGWLVRQDERVYVIAPHISQPDHPSGPQMGCGVMVIPTAVVKTMRTLLPLYP